MLPKLFQTKTKTETEVLELYIKDNLILTANQLYNIVYTMHHHPHMATIKDDFCFFKLETHTDEKIYKILSEQYLTYKILTLNEILQKLRTIWELILKNLDKEAKLQKHKENLAKLIETVDKTMPELRHIMYIPQPMLDSEELRIKTRMAEDYINNIETKFMENVDKVVKTYGFVKITVPKQEFIKIV